MNNIPTNIMVIVAIIVAWIGFQQFLLARERFKLDLFEKRFAVYKAAQKLLSIILRDAKIELNDIFDYQKDRQDAVFLFDKKIVDYLDALYSEALALSITREEYKDLPVGKERTKLVEKGSNILKELLDELPKLKDVFSPYLKFKTW